MEIGKKEKERALVVECLNCLSKMYQREGILIFFIRVWRDNVGMEMI